MNKPILCLYRPQPDKSKYELCNSFHPIYYNDQILYGQNYVFFWSFSELSAMIAGMEDSKKYVIINYQSPDELDKSFDHFMGNWLWRAICIQSVAYYHLECNNNNWNRQYFSNCFLWMAQNNYIADVAFCYLNELVSCEHEKTSYKSSLNGP